MSAAPLTLAPGGASVAAAASPAVAPTAARIPVWRWVLYDAVVWTGATFLFAVQSGMHSTSSLGHLLAAHAVSFIPCALFTPIIVLVALRYRFTDGTRLRSTVAHGLCLGAFLTLGSVMMGALEWSLPWVPYGDGLWAAVRPALWGYFATDTLIYLLLVMAALSLAYGRESRVRALRAARLQTQLAEAQLHVLSAQLQPHFLFNTLHVISALVRHDPKRAEQLIARLSDLLREMLDNSDRTEVTLSEELAFLEKYVEIQEARFGSRLQVSFEIAQSVLDCNVPRLVLQPLVENAIRHGVARRSDPGTVVVSAHLAGETLVLIVRDDGVGLPADGQVRDGVGLTNTRARLLQLYGPASHFTIERALPWGTQCTIVIPNAARAELSA